MIWKIILCLALGYLFGCIQTGYFYGRMHGIDLREHGSGNVGTTNVMRVFGKKAGILIYASDALKAIIPVLLVRFVIFPGMEETQLLSIYTGLGAVLGHDFPFYMKNFKGGKGIAATSGAMAAFDFRFIIPEALGFFIAFFTTCYVSVGSLVLATLFPILVLVFYPGQWHIFVISLIYCILAYWQHRENIKRLRNGTENGFLRKSAKKKEKKDEKHE